MRKTILTTGIGLMVWVVCGIFFPTDVVAQTGNGAAPSSAVIPRRGSARLVLDPASPAYVGQFATGNNAAVIKFTRTVKGRYFSFDTFSAHDNRPFAAIAELELLDETGQPMDRASWRVIYADSEEMARENGAASNAIDGDPDSHWHTEWGVEMQNHPHRLILDLGEVRFISGFRYLPRQGAPTAGGRIKDFSVGVSESLKEETPVVHLLPDPCYLFAYFTSDERDGLHLAWSMDGFRWDVVNRGRSVLKPGATNLLRDPFLAPGPDGTFHLVWTRNWRGNSIGYARSRDLIHWSVPMELPVMSAEPATLNCWAPEFFYDEARKEFIIFWSSAVTNLFRETLGRAGEVGNQRLFCTTTKDFRKFTPTRLYCDPGFSVIDATMVAAAGEYHLIFKDETDQTPGKNLRSVSAPSPHGPFGAVSLPFSPPGVEGPNVFRVGSDYIVYFRHHIGGSGRWGVMKSTDLKHWEAANERLALPGTVGVHQGTVLPVPQKMILDLWRESLVELGPTPAATELGIGNWVWTTSVTDKQTCRLWHSFQVPAETLVSRATLRITADNGYRLFLDGREIGRGGDFNSLTEFDLTPLMFPGSHVLAVEAFNDAANAGVILGLQVELSNGRKLALLSDPSWLVVPRDVSRWESRKQPGEAWQPARVVAFAGRQVWARPERIIPAPPLQPVETHFWQRGWFLTSLLVICAVVVALSVRLGLQLAVQSRSSRLLERERARIARDVHDDLGAGLTQLTLEGELILRDTGRDTQTHQQVNALCNRGRALLGSLDEVVWAVNPRRDTVQDFIVFICEHAQSFLGPTEIRCRLDVPEVLPATPMDLPARRNLLLAVKEAVRNAARHSGGDEISLQVRVTDGHLTVAVTDNGHGFDPKAAAASRHGLGNMQERLADVGGVCELVATPGNGCRVTFRVPLITPQLQGNKLFSAIRQLFQKRKSPEVTP
jgi:signal transduction histidine kinase